MYGAPTNQAMSVKSFDPYSDVSTWSKTDERVHVVIDTPKGSRNKFKFDASLGLFKLGHVLPLGAYFPYDFGAVPQTAADDGDPIDVMVIADEPTFVGCVQDVQLIGVIEAQQTVDAQTVRNDRLLGVPVTSVNSPALNHINELGAEAIGQLELFFEAYNRAHGRKFVVQHRRGPEAARQLVTKAAAKYAEEANK
jgi:inorganic pyrophosphatase